MKLLKLTAALSVLMLLALSAAAQEPGTIAAIELDVYKRQASTAECSSFRWSCASSPASPSV